MRLFLPSLFAVCAPIAVVPATRRNLAAVLLAPWVLLAIVAMRPPQGTDVVPGEPVVPGGYGSVTVDDFGWGEGGPQSSWYEGPAFYVQQGAFGLGIERVELPLKGSVTLPTGALSGIGLASYSMGTDFRVIDRFGLADPLTAHFRLRESDPPYNSRPGHQKPLPTVWLLARVTPPGSDPDPALIAPPGPQLIPTTSGAEFREQLAWARAALRCPGIRDMLNAAYDELVGRTRLAQRAPLVRKHATPDPSGSGGGLPRVLRVRHATGGERRLGRVAARSAGRVRRCADEVVLHVRIGRLQRDDVPSGAVDERAGVVLRVDGPEQRVFGVEVLERLDPADEVRAGRARRTRPISPWPPSVTSSM